MFAIPLRPDVRRVPEHEDASSTCRRCGAGLVVLPDDRRMGYCFDCYDPSEVRAEHY